MTETDIKRLYQKALDHKKEHACAGVPYDQGAFLTGIVNDNNVENILEVGTGIGYSTACLALGNTQAHIDSIDKDREHLTIAKNEWQTLEINDRITILQGKVEDLIPTLNTIYDLIFYDGYVPQKKLVPYFYFLLKPGGILVSANLYLAQPNGGRYAILLKDTRKWDTEFFGDTAIARKVLTQES